MSISTVMYERMGLSNAEIAFYTSALYLPWVVKPLWSPFIDLAKSKRWWILAMEFLIAAAIAGVAFTLPSAHFLVFTLMFLWMMAFSSATHDIAADGFTCWRSTRTSKACMWASGARSTASPP